MIIALDKRQPCQNDAICSHSIHIVSVETEFPYSARRAMTKLTAAQTPSIILLTTGKSLTASTTSGTWTCFREKPYVPENRIHHHDHDDEEQYCDDVARFRDGGHGYEQ